MKIVVQRVSKSSVLINKTEVRKISKGLLLLIGIVDDDSEEDIEWLINKILNLRIFDDENDFMNLSLNDISGEIMVISQFTLLANIKKGNRPSYIKAAKPEIAIHIYNKFLETLQKKYNKTIVSGEFGANMSIELINDGPVTILMDSKNKDF